jgi:ADP-heptose:LPS heptosyltransferase
VSRRRQSATDQAVADELISQGRSVVQFFPDLKAGPRLRGVRQIRTLTFRDAVAVLKNSALYIGPEGGMHHAAAAVDVPGVVLFGGFIPPSVTGYDTHTNLVGSDYFCGSFTACKHCADAMNSISIETVLKAARERL